MPTKPCLDESYPADPASVPRARTTLARFAASAGATPEQLESIEMAVSEALTNAVVHAYGDDPGDIHVVAAVAGAELWILIADDGRGMRARAGSPGLGVGLALIAHAADGFAVAKRSTGGTELQMRFRLDELAAGDQLRGSVPSAVAPA
ncbi:MAG: ATP-binding protein [Solirubrobacterales bacterium]|nr:ATP-binding protein [Solirubrobacterales bacterium]